MEEGEGGERDGGGQLAVGVLGRDLAHAMDREETKGGGGYDEWQSGEDETHHATYEHVLAHGFELMPALLLELAQHGGLPRKELEDLDSLEQLVGILDALVTLLHGHLGIHSSLVRDPRVERHRDDEHAERREPRVPHEIVEHVRGDGELQRSLP